MLEKKTKLKAISLIGSAFLIAFCGCAENKDQWTKDRPKVYPVQGQVLFNGEPLAEATVKFISEEKDLTASGRTDSSGNFQLMTFDPNDGAVAGKHVVTVTKTETEVTPHPDDPELGPIDSETRSLIPEHYSNAEESELTAEVGSDGSNEFTFELSE